jgi:Leucine-rich repeat (LRR) protein
MRKTLALCLLLWTSWNAAAQDSLKIYTWEQALLASPDSVFRLDASKQKWDSLPARLFTFTKLQYLNISKNRLTDLPTELSALKNLMVIDASRNKLSTFPMVLCQTTQIRKLLLSRNLIPSIPPCIGYYSQLTVLDVWDNPLRSLPEELIKIKTLKMVDLRGILFNSTFQEKWVTAMPETKWHFDPPCHCLD